MRIVLGGDHAGFELKQNLLAYVREMGHEVLDAGTHSTAAVDYPDYAEAVGTAVRNREVDRGILICGSGVGASVAANKIRGIRAGLCHDTYSARQGVEHDDMNVLVLGSRVIAAELAHELVRNFLSAQFSGEERHVRRLGKVKHLEEKLCVEPRSTDVGNTASNDVIVTGDAAGFAQEIRAGAHLLHSDEPVAAGGTDTGPTPYGLLLAALGACTSMTVALYARRKAWPLAGVTVGLRHSRIYASDCAECETKQGMLDRIERDIRFNGSLTPEQRGRLLDIANKCPVHRTLKSEIDIQSRVV
jgi:RpiB/LacA/LacB family sugar-phosphate isomerase